MKRKLSRAFVPPAPMVPVALRAPGGVDTSNLEGKLDTGADLSAVPQRIIVELDLPPSRTVRAAGFAGALQEAIVYRVDVEIDGQQFPHVEALATQRAYVVIGRNVLRHLVFRIDGPAEQFELRRPRKRS